MGSALTRPAVMAHLVKHAGKPVTLEDLTSVTGFTATQVQSQLRNLIKDGHPVSVLVRAQIWKYEPTTEPEPEPVNPDERDVTNIVYEGIGRTGAGAIIVRDVDTRTLYVLRELDI
jgi:hypothetical protein